MSSRPYCLIGIFVALALAGQARASGNHPQQLAPAIGNAAAVVHFDLYQGYFIVVHGAAGPLKKLNFFLDTGTIRSTFDSRTAKKLNLHDQEPASIMIVGGRVQGEAASLSSLELGPLQLSNLDIVTADLSFFQRALPIHIDAIIGIDVLGQTPFVIDYSAHVIRFGTTPALSVSVPLHLDQGLAVFDAEIDHTPMHLLFDTGASSLVLFTTAKQQGSSVKPDAALGPDAIGHFESRQVYLDSLRLGPAEFRKEPALVTPNPKPSQLNFDGLMSPAALGISRVSVDIERKVLAFSR